jgi:hypothetical protein
MTSTTIDRLSQLSAQRTARTDRLRDATVALLAILSEHCEVGDEATVDGCTLERGCVSGRNYHGETWFLTTRGKYEDEESACDLQESADGYYGGDFDLPRRGAHRDDLIAFASRADRFVAALLDQIDQENTRLESGAATVAKAVLDVEKGRLA